MIMTAEPSTRKASESLQLVGALLLLPLLMHSSTVNASRCESIRASRCQDMPYSRTSVGDQDNAELQVAIVEAMLQFEPACSPDLRAFLCGAYMPKCDDDDGTVVLPCASTCNSVRRSCQPVIERWGFSWPEYLNCGKFPTQGEEVCMDLVSDEGRYPPPDVPTGECQPMRNLQTPTCNSMPYRETRLPSLAGHTKLIDAEIALMAYRPLIHVDCSSALQAFLCSFYFPKCDANVDYPIGPCASTCEEARSGCEPLMNEFGIPWPDEFECSRFSQGNAGSQVCI